MAEVILPPEQTVGYRYYLGLHFVTSHGPVDAVTEIIAGERTAWSGEVTASQQVTIDAEDLFGGDEREGGIKGQVDFAFGEDAQPVNDYLASRIGSPQPAYRGVLSFIFRQVYMTANNPYIKAIAFRLRRVPGDWNAGEARIGDGANPAHIIRECLTDPAWGMGYPESSIDDATFLTASSTLVGESFGLSMLWTQQTPIREFIQGVIDHIGGVLVVSPLTGQFQLKLIRGDYDPGALPVLNEDNVLSVGQYQRAGWGETINELTVVYTRPDTWKDTQITLQDLASYQIQGPTAETRRYPGITDDDLAARVAMRDLTAVSRPLAKATLTVNREAWSLLPGDPFKLTWDALGIVELIMRVVTIDTGTVDDAAIRVEVIEDTWAFADNAYTAPQPPGWTDPTQPPVDVNPRLIVEANYWQLAQRLPPDALADLDQFDGFVSTLGGRPSSAALNYELYTQSGTTWTGGTARGNGDFSPHCVMDAPMAPEFQSVVPIIGGVDLDIVQVGRYAYLQDPDDSVPPNPAGFRHEVVEVLDLDLTAGTVTLGRGLIDSVPAYHAQGVRLWFAESFEKPDLVTYIYTEQMAARMLTRTGLGTLDLATAAQENYTVQYRKEAPYPPGNLRFNGLAYPPGFEATLTVTWAHRDRTQQTADYPRQTDPSVGPEPTTVYNMRIYGETGVLQRTFSGITGTSQAYTIAEDIADNGLGRPSNLLTVELESQRGAFVSWYIHRYTLVRNEAAGWGLQWGYNYGGPP